MKHRFPAGCPKRLEDLIGRRVRVKKEMVNGFISVPAGTIMTVDYSNRWEDLRLTGPACNCCRISPRIRGVSIGDVTIVNEADLLAAANAGAGD